MTALATSSSMNSNLSGASTHILMRMRNLCRVHRVSSKTSLQKAEDLFCDG